MVDIYKQKKCVKFLNLTHSIIHIFNFYKFFFFNSLTAKSAARAVKAI
jgi:hypothetical protein